MFTSGIALSTGITTIKSIGKKFITTTCGFRRPVNSSDVFVPAEQAAEYYLVNVHGMSNSLANRVLCSDANKAVELVQAFFNAAGNYRGGNAQICATIVSKAFSLKVK